MSLLAAGVRSGRKLIEASLPLDAINRAAAREKSIRHGHPSTLHLWWARRPLAAARAVIFAQMVDDPSACPEEFPTAEDQERERRRLFGIVEELVLWESTTKESVLEKAREEIRRSWRRTCAANAGHPRAAELFDPERLPAFHDPFAGGGALPLEAQRLGLVAHASDLNPVAVLINKAMIEVPPRFAGRPPANPEARSGVAGAGAWPGASGLAADVRFYGQWMRDEAERRIGHLYPKAAVTEGMVRERPDLAPYAGRELTVIAWLWARTVRSPNPAFADVEVPLVSTFMLSTKQGREAYVEPVVEGRGYRFEVRAGKPADMDAASAGTKLGRGANFRCVMSGTPMNGDHIKGEGKANRMGARLMAVVAEGNRARVYLAPTTAQESVASQARPSWGPDIAIPPDRRSMFTPLYGLTHFSHLFTSRQLVALTTFSDLVAEATERVRADAAAAGVPDDREPLRDGGSGATAYAHAVAVYLAFALSRSADRGSTICSWDNSPKMEALRNTFGRQAIPMVWDFAEGNPFSSSTGSWSNNVEWCVKAVTDLPGGESGYVQQADATDGPSVDVLFSTDPPYYDNIGYADLSDFFYVWLRRTLRPLFRDLFATLAVPKAEELVATPYRHGSRERAEKFFLAGMTRAMERLAAQSHAAFPVTIYYAFKQAERKGGAGITRTGWETFLEAVIRSGFAVTGTWPMRTELANRMIGMGANALASSIVLVCRRRPDDAPLATSVELRRGLRAELLPALRTMQTASIAPVDLAQAAIGPGMAVYTRHAKVLDAQGNPVSVRDALALINQVLDEVLQEQEGDFDGDTRWAVAWFEQYGFDEADFGAAETLSKAKNTSIDGLVEAGMLASKAGKVRLLRSSELRTDWDPSADGRLTVWETVHHLVRTLEAGELKAADLVRRLGSVAEGARELAYRLFAIAERTNRTQDARSYNGLVQSWPEISRLAQRSPARETASLLDEEPSRGA